MNWMKWVLVADLGLMGLVQAWRGARRTTKTYDEWDVMGAIVEVGLLIWLVVIA